MSERIVIPRGITFDDLKVYRVADGDISIDAAIAAIVLRANGVPPDAPHAPERACGIIVAWYWQHRADGGSPNDVIEDFIREARNEQLRGLGATHKPGSA